MKDTEVIDLINEGRRHFSFLFDKVSVHYFELLVLYLSFQKPFRPFSQIPHRKTRKIKVRALRRLRRLTAISSGST